MNNFVRFIFLVMLCSWSWYGTAEAALSLQIGFHAKSFPDFSVEDVEISVKLLAEELGKEIGVETHVDVYEDIRAMRQDFEQGKINFVVASSILLVKEFNSALFVDGFRFVRISPLSDRVIVLGQIKPGKRTLQDYRGDRLALAQYDPMTDLYLDYVSWLTFKRSYQNSFKLLGREKKAHQLILKLFFDSADVTCVYQNAYATALEMNPQLEKKLQIIAQTEFMPQGMGLFHRNTPVEFRELVIAEALKLADRPRGQQLLNLFKSERAIRSTYADLDAALKLNTAYQNLILKK